MSRIRLVFSGPLDDYAELLRELHNHNVDTTTVDFTVTGSGEQADAIVELQDQTHFVQNVIRTFTDRPSVRMSTEDV